MSLFLFRHGERESTFAPNPPLNARGLSQAQSLATRILKRDLPAPDLLFVSPKKRTHQTFAALAELVGAPLLLRPGLDERVQGETSADFTLRVRETLDFLSSQTGVVYACSHVDWIEEALIVMPGLDGLVEKLGSWAPAQFAEFDVREGLWSLKRSGRIEG